MKIARAAWAFPWALPLFWTGCSDETLIDPNAGAGTGGTSGASGASGSAGTSASGAAGTAPLGGSAGTATSGGSAGSASSGGVGGAVTTTGGTAGSTAGGGAGGAGNAGTGGMPPQGGVAGTDSSGGVAGTQAGSGGDGGTAGEVAGTGGTAGETAGTAGTAGAAGNLNDIAADLHGHTILMPCGQDTEVRVCRPIQVNQGCAAGNDPALAGGRSHDETITIGGTPGTFYNITLRIHGMVEAKTYRNGGMDRNNSGNLPADGLYTGGQPDNQANGYNIYLIRTSSPQQDYFLNSIAAGNDTRIRHSVFEIDFTFDIRVEGGSTVRLVSADPNCSAIKNCAEPDVGGVCNAVTINGLDPLIASAIKSQPYNGQFVGVLVEGVTVAP